MKTPRQIMKNIFAPLLFACLAACGGGGDAATPEDVADPLPDFTPTADESLASLAVNTFKDNGVEITTDPESIDFVESEGSLTSGDVVSQEFAITNSTAATRTFKFQIYSVSSGFTILDENKDNVGSWQAITLAAGESKKYYVQFSADLFGTQTSYLTITADIDGYIHLPFRATVTGSADFKLVPTGYSCSDADAPTADALDFLKVAYGKSRTKGLKLCNTGGEDVKITSASIVADDSGLISEIFTPASFVDFDWTAAGSIESVFSSGSQTTGASINAPTLVDCGGVVDNAAGDFSAVARNGDSISNITVTGSSFLWMDISFSPSIDMEAGEGELCNPLSVNAKLKLDTSLGVVEVPLLGATAGSEPVLEMYYRLAGYETKEEGASEEAAGTPYYRPLDLASDGTAIIFGTTEIYADWVSEGYETAEVLIKNVGSGTKKMQFAGGNMTGFFEYDASAVFPAELAAGESAAFTIRYVPTPEETPETATWDFGQMYFTHNAGNNGPVGKIALVGEQDAGYAVEVTYSGADMRKYSETNSDGSYKYTKNFCVINTEKGAAAAVSTAEDEGKTLGDPAGHTQLTFAVKNNSRITGNILDVSWRVVPDSKTATSGEGESATQFTYTQFEEQSGSLTVSPDSSGEFTSTITLKDDDTYSVPGGENITGQVIINTKYADSVWATYQNYSYGESGMGSGASEQTFVIPFQAKASDSGVDCIFDATALAQDDFKGTVTFIIDRLSMALMDLTEDNRSYPPFKFHMPLEVDKAKGTVRVQSPIIFDYSGVPQRAKQITSPLHQSTGISGCAAMPTNPYRLREERYSWGGPTSSCGEMVASNTKDGNISIYGDMVCMANNGAQPYTDTVTGETKQVFYSEFAMINEECEIQYYGKFSTFAFNPETETIRDIFKKSEEKPNESEEYYEEIYGAFAYDTYITFIKETTCGGVTYAQGGQPETITDIDAVKACYKELSADTGGTRRVDGFITECAEFNFSMDEGKVPDDADSENPDYDKWEGFGTYEPHRDANGDIVEGQYDITLYNVNIQAFVVGAADRVSFFGHPGHLLYSDLSITLSTKVVADGNYGDESSANWQERIAVNTRPHFTKEKVFLKDEDPYDLDKYFLDDGLNNMLTNMINPFDPNLELGKDRGNFQFTDSGERIVLSGRPINLEQNNMLILSGLGSFGGVGNTAPPFTKRDAATGRGKSLYFTFHGCLVNSEDPDPYQGCQSYSRDSDMLNGRPIVETYVEKGMIPETMANIEAFNCEDSSQADFGISAVSMPCINYTIYGIDRNRYTSYYDPTDDDMIYPAPGQYKYSSTDDPDYDPSKYDEYVLSDYKCGIGM